MIVTASTSCDAQINIKATAEVNVNTPKMEWVKLLCSEK